MRAFRPLLAVAAVAIGCVFGLALAEGAARVVAPHWREYSSARFTALETVAGVGTFAVGRPGFDGYFAQNDGNFRVRVRLNEAGHRNAEPPAAANGRIWVLGDSFTFGWGVAAGEMYSAVLGRAAAAPVYNVSAPGGDVRNYRRLLAQMPKGALPRLVVVGLTIENDLIDYGESAPAEPESSSPRNTPPRSFKQWWAENSALYNLAAVAAKKSEFFRAILAKAGIVAPVHDVRAAPEAQTARKLAESTADEIVRLRDGLAPGTPVVVLAIPARFEFLAPQSGWVELRKAVVGALAARNVPVVDPTAAIAEAGFAATHFPHDGHWSARGHELAGRALAAWISTSMPVARIPQ